MTVGTLLLRADAGPSIGLGHLSRCVALAEEATVRGWRVAFSGELGSAAWLGETLADLGVRLLRPVPDPDSLASQAVAVGADVVLADHYGLRGDLRTAVRCSGALLTSVEDGVFGRRAADVVVDCGLASTSRPPDGSPIVLRGPAFAPLRSVVRTARESRGRQERATRPPRVLVLMGGGAASEAVHAALCALRDTREQMRVCAISAQPIRPPATMAGQRIVIRPPQADLPDLLVESDLVVSAAGVTMLELCCIGVPMALVELTANQADGYRAALRRGVAVGLGSAAELIADHGRPTEVLGELLADAEFRARIAATAAATVDGRGAARILDAVTTPT
jgi:spore coat polysaccharide biosynthesis predicted glycosyltransferase SpsG